MKKQVVIALLCLTGSVQAATIGALVVNHQSGDPEWESLGISGGDDVSYAYKDAFNDLVNSGGYSYGAYTSQAEAIFDLDALTPVLRAQASFAGSNNEDAYVESNATAYQTYMYTGAQASTYTIDLNLHGVIDSSQSWIDARFYVFSGTDCGFSYRACSGNILASAFTQGLEFVMNGDHTLLNQITFGVNPGDTFQILASLNVLVGPAGGTADAYNTFTSTFTDKSNLTALGEMSAPVPLPASIWLFGTGLLGLFGIVRIRNRQ